MYYHLSPRANIMLKWNNISSSEKYKEIHWEHLQIVLGEKQLQYHLNTFVEITQHAGYVVLKWYVILNGF